MNTTFETKHGREAGKDEWLTPPEIIKALGEFDLDPCSPINRPWDTAKNHFTELDNGLMQNWYGKVFCNPPYGKQTAHWLNKCAMHGNAIALTFARTETNMFFDYVWNKATAVLFIKGRLRFYHVTGQQADSAGAPSVLIAYGKDNAELLKNCSIKGKFLWCNNEMGAEREVDSMLNMAGVQTQRKTQKCEATPSNPGSSAIKTIQTNVTSLMQTK